MVHPGITFAVMLGVAVGAALYYVFSQDTTQRAHSYQTDSGDDIGYNSWDRRTSTPRSSVNGSSSDRRRKRRSSASQCSICQEQNLGTNTITLSCGHEFHCMCLNKWLTQQKTCPNCRCTIWQ